jgi:hypothetical protein
MSDWQMPSVVKTTLKNVTTSLAQINELADDASSYDDLREILDQVEAMHSIVGNTLVPALERHIIPIQG